MCSTTYQHKYIENFIEAQSFSKAELGLELTPKMNVDPEWSMSLSGGMKHASDALRIVVDNGYQLGGHCFLVTALLSSAFIRAGIPHEITIGNVEWKSGGLYNSATRESLMEDIEVGFNPTLEGGVPELEQGRAHAWITLPNGEVVDATIIAWRDRELKYTGRSKSGFRQWIYRNKNKDIRVARHIPILTGLSYHLRSVTGVRHDLEIEEEFFQFYNDWAKEYLAFMAQFSGSAL